MFVYILCFIIIFISIISFCISVRTDRNIKKYLKNQEKVYNYLKKKPNV